MRREIYFILIACLLIIPAISAVTIEEKTLSEFGSLDFVVEKDNNMCQMYEFNNLSTLDNYSSILQLNIKNYIPVTDGVNIKIYLNDNLEQEIINKDILQNNIIRLSDFQENNSLNICIENQFLPKIVIAKESKVGNYLLSEIKEENFYQKVTAKAYTDVLVPIEVFVKNTGYADQEIKIINASKKFIKNSGLENVSGETAFEGIIKAGEEKNIIYNIKTTNDLNYITPRAILKYTDEFGRYIELYTNPEVISIIEDITKLSVYIDVPREILVKEEYIGKIIIRNTTEDEIENIFITPKFDGDIELTYESLPIIKKKDVVSIPFKIKTYDTKKYDVGFDIQYTINGIDKSVGSPLISINSVQEDKTNKTITAILIALAIILFIWFVKI